MKNFLPSWWHGTLDTSPAPLESQAGYGSTLEKDPSFNKLGFKGLSNYTTGVSIMAREWIWKADIYKKIHRPYLFLQLWKMACMPNMYLILKVTSQKDPHGTFLRYIRGTEDKAHWFWLPCLLWKHLVTVLNNLKQVKTIPSPGDGECHAWFPTALWHAVGLSSKRQALTKDFPEHWSSIKFGGQCWFSHVS